MSKPTPKPRPPPKPDISALKPPIRPKPRRIPPSAPIKESNPPPRPAKPSHLSKNSSPSSKTSSENTSPIPVKKTVITVGNNKSPSGSDGTISGVGKISKIGLNNNEEHLKPADKDVYDDVLVDSRDG